MSNITVMAFSPRNIVGCLLKKRLTKGGSRAPQDPPPPRYALAVSLHCPHILHNGCAAVINASVSSWCHSLSASPMIPSCQILCLVYKSPMQLFLCPIFHSFFLLPSRIIWWFPDFFITGSSIPCDFMQSFLTFGSDNCEDCVYYYHYYHC